MLSAQTVRSLFIYNLLLIFCFQFLEYRLAQYQNVILMPIVHMIKHVEMIFV